MIKLSSFILFYIICLGFLSNTVSSSCKNHFQVKNPPIVKVWGQAVVKGKLCYRFFIWFHSEVILLLPHVVLLM